MSGIWYALAAVAIALVVRWYILSEPKRSSNKFKVGKEEPKPPSQMKPPR